MDRGSHHGTDGMNRIIPKDKKLKKTKWLSEEALQITEKRSEGKCKGKREK